MDTTAPDRALDALGNGTRRQILELLSTRPRAVVEIADVLPISRPAVSKHLRVLERASLVTFERSGRRHEFRVRPEGFEPVRGWLDRFWHEGLTRLKDIAESSTAPEADESS